MIIKIPNTLGAWEPKNLDKLPEWIKCKLGTLSLSTERLELIQITAPLTYNLVAELRLMAADVAVNMANSNRKEEGKFMCSTLHLIYKAAADQIEEKLEEASFRASQGTYRLTLRCLEESPSGKRFLHSLPSGKGTYAWAPFLGDEKYATADRVAELLAPLAEAEVARS